MTAVMGGGSAHPRRSTSGPGWCGAQASTGRTPPPPGGRVARPSPPEPRGTGIVSDAMPYTVSPEILQGPNPGDDDGKR